MLLQYVGNRQSRDDGAICYKHRKVTHYTIVVVDIVLDVDLFKFISKCQKDGLSRI